MGIDIIGREMMAYSNQQLSHIVYNIKSLGAKGDGITDDTDIIVAAINNVDITALYFPIGDYLISGMGTEILLITHSIKMFGEGGKRSKLIVNASATCDVIRLTGIHNQTEISEIGFWNGGGGRHSIHIDLTTGGDLFMNGKIEKCLFDNFSGNAIKLTNPTNMDGFFTSYIGECFITGGINLERAGDSISIVRNTISSLGIGINMTTVAGALRTFISENNITANGGAIVLNGVDEVSIRNNQIEQVVAIAGLGTGKACITINGGNNITIEENNIAASGGADYCITLDNTKNVQIDKNTLWSAIAYPTHINIADGAINTFIGYHNTPTYEGTIEENLRITDAGLGTTNIDISLTLLAGWVSHDTVNNGVARGKKTYDGIVNLSGVLKSGTNTPGTKLCILPPGFCPKVNVYKIVSTWNTLDISAGIQFSVIQILNTGDVYIVSNTTPLGINLSDISFEAGTLPA